MRHSRKRQLRSVKWPLIAAAVAGVAIARTRDRLSLPRPVSGAVAASVPPMLAVALPRGKPRTAIVWAAHMWAYKILFELPYDRPAWLRDRVHVDYVIRSDRALGAGRPLPQRLQSRLRRPPDLTPLDYAASLFYATWDAEPHLALAWILWRHAKRFPAAAVRLGAVFDSTLLGYWLLPTAPPWWASEEAGRMDREVRRVVIEVKRALGRKPRPVGDHRQGANPWASMPSDHFASALMTARVVSDVNRTAGVFAYGYALTLGAVLVYLGEHYVTDLVAGGALACAVEGVARRVYLKGGAKAALCETGSA